MPESVVYNMDCVVGLQEVPDKYFDLILTDPPYGVNLDYRTYVDTEENWFALMSKFIPEARRVSRMVVMPSCRIKALPFIYQNFPPDWIMCWYKGSPGIVSYVGFNDWEPLLVYGKNAGVQMHDYLAIRNDEPMGQYGHPCPKPIKWYKHLLQRCNPNNGHVCDPFLGSGTGRIAAHEMGFDFTGYEIDKDYFEAQEKRFHQYKSQLKIFQ
jgi:site-specific DNA-methyltransferase (adenine-specific)